MDRPERPDLHAGARERRPEKATFADALSEARTPAHEAEKQSFEDDAPPANAVDPRPERAERDRGQRDHDHHEHADAAAQPGSADHSDSSTTAEPAPSETHEGAPADAQRTPAGEAQAAPVTAQPLPEAAPGASAGASASASAPAGSAAGLIQPAPDQATIPAAAPQPESAAPATGADPTPAPATRPVAGEIAPAPQPTIEPSVDPSSAGVEGRQPVAGGPSSPSQQAPGAAPVTTAPEPSSNGAVRPAAAPTPQEGPVAQHTVNRTAPATAPVPAPPAPAASAAAAVVASTEVTSPDIAPASARARQVEAAVQLENATGAAPQADGSVRVAAPVPVELSAMLQDASHKAVDGGSTPPSSVSRLDADEEAFAARVVRSLNVMVNQRGGVMNMRLQPPELGALRVQMTLVSGSVTADFHVATQQAQTLLDRNLMSLRTALEAQGLSVERLTVHPATNPHGAPTTREESSDQSGQQRQQHDAGHGQSRGRSGEDAGRSWAEHFAGTAPHAEDAEPFAARLTT